MFAAAKETSRQLENPLVYLPHRSVSEYLRREIIFDEQHPSNGLCVVTEGRVKVTTKIAIGTALVTGIFYPNEFFGAEALLGAHSTHRQKATAMEVTKVMWWSRADVEEQIERQPKLGIALIGILAAQGREFQERLQSLALDKTVERLAASLLRFARSGRRGANGSVLMPPLTHQFLAEYVSTSREGVTLHMNHLRQQGFVRYSRKTIEIFPDAIVEHLRKQQTGNCPPPRTDFDSVRDRQCGLTA